MALLRTALATNKIGKDAVSKSSFAMIVLAAISTSLLLMPDSATARAGGVSRGSHGTASGGTRGAVVRSWHGRSGHLGRHRAFRSGQGRWSCGVIGVAVDPASYGYGPGLEPGCELQRLQFSDEHGWRVRDVVVCR